MADFSVKAILSATDRGFSSTMRGAMGTVGKLDSKISSFTTGLLQGAGQQAFGMLTSGAANLVGEINQSSKAWQTFEGNMKNFGKTPKDIEDARTALQKFAEETVYSSSDMASTYAQLEAVGVGSMKSLKNGTEGLVKGFGGLAAAAEDPQQAMKSLSQQATQMAAKPKVAWEDFKIMLEQSPAGMAAVAKAMGKSTSELISDIQAGEVKTKDFFTAIEKAGTSAEYGFAEMATKAKTVDQAFDGLKEGIGNRLLPTFNMLSQKGIAAIDGISNKLGTMPTGEEIATKVSGWIEKAQPYWVQFKNVLTIVGGIIKKVGQFLLEHSNIISKAIPIILGAVAAYKGFMIVNSIVGAVKGFANSFLSFAGKAGASVAENLDKTATAQKNVGTSAMESNKSMLTSAKAFMMLGAGVLLVAAGFGILALSAIKLAEAGPLAIGVMAGLVVALVAVGAGMGFLLKVLSPMSAGMLAVGGAMLMMGAAFALVGAGVYLITAGLSLLADKLPAIATHGLAAARGIVALSASLVTFAAGTLAAAAGAIALGAGILVAGAAALVAGAGFIVFGAGVIVASGGMLVLKGALMLVNSSLKSISKNAKSTAKTLKSMKSSVKLVGSGLDALGNKAKSAMNKLKSAFDNTASKAKSAGKKTGTGFATGMKGGLNNAVSYAKSASSKVISALNKTASQAKSAGAKAGKAYASGVKTARAGVYSAGSYIAKGLAQGMKSQLGIIRNVANQMAAAAEKAVKAKAKIHSPSKLFATLGAYIGEGFAGGIESMSNAVARASENLVNIPNVARPNFATAGGELSNDYSYGGMYEFTIPLEVDGREIAKATVRYSQDELNKRETRESRKRGKV